MQSIFGALLTAGYAAAFAAAIASAPNASQVTTSVQNQLTKSFSSAADVAQTYPQYSKQIIAGAKSSFLDGAHWAYTAGIIAVVVGAVIVFFLFPRKEREEELLAAYHAQDQQRMGVDHGVSGTTGGAPRGTSRGASGSGALPDAPANDLHRR
jgi:hypothetical protein